MNLLYLQDDFVLASGARIVLNCVVLPFFLHPFKDILKISAFTLVELEEEIVCDYFLMS